MAEELTQDQLAAHSFLTELRTRISTQDLPFRHGVEASALKSLYDLFELGRLAIKDHPGCKEFARLTIEMLNQSVRPKTAYWHRQSSLGVLDTRDGAIEFREDLAEVQKALRIYADKLHVMAYGTHIEDQWAASEVEESPRYDPSGDIKFGISRHSGLIRSADIDLVNDREADEIRAIRKAQGRDDLSPDEPITNATGLAFSGGGIRSASFGLGVAQEFADKKLLEGFDIMSTVSGGGYVGGFISRRMAEEGSAALAYPDGPDTLPVAWLRQRAAYLAQGGSLLLASRVVAGMLLNWTAPAFLVAALSCVVLLFRGVLEPVVPWLPGLGAIAAVVALLVYGNGIRRNTDFADRALLSGLGVAAVCWVGYGLTELYQLAPGLVDIAGGWSVVGVFGATLPAFSLAMRSLARPLVRKGMVQAALAIAAALVPLIFLGFGMWMFHIGSQLSADMGGIPGWIVLLVLTIVLGLVAAAIDINETGPHRIYREGLAQTFVQKDPSDHEPAPLVALNQSGRAPHHLINAVVNLPGSKSVRLRERKGDFFLFSKGVCGAPTTGFYRTEDMKTGDASVDLASALAISGAAVAPHMALMTFSPLRMLLAFLNLRLGYWLAVPGRANGKPSLLHLVREMFGTGMDDDASRLFLTDGGHLENTGVYELLRRRCRYIVAVDGGADAVNSFTSLTTLSRHARIDLGIDIELALDELRVNIETGLSPAHAVLTRVNYPATEDLPPGTGLLLLIKLSLTGDEGEMTATYAKTNPDFPHHSTADQFFDEAQFENYRRLGVHAARSLFAPVLIGPEEVGSNVQGLLQRLSATILR